MEFFLTTLLKTKTSVESLDAGIETIPVECLALIIDYLRLSRSLKDLTI
jgi:hypothetical protein